MAKQALINLKTKPKAPKRQKVKLRHQLDEGTTLATILQSFAGDNLDEVFFESETESDYYSNHEYTTSYFSIRRLEHEEEYQKQVERYKVRLARYERWYKENEETILTEIARRRQKAKDRVLRVAQAEEKRLKKELKKVERFLRK